MANKRHKRLKRSVMLKRLALGTSLSLVASLCLPLSTTSMAQNAPPEEEQDPFSQVEEMLKQQESAVDEAVDENFSEADAAIKAQFDMVAKIIEEAYAAAEMRIKAGWGSDAKLPERTVWTGYTSNLQERVIVDYAAGEIIIQSQKLLSPAEMTKTMEKVLTMPSAALDAMDPIQVEIKKVVVKKSLTATLTKPTVKPVKKELAAIADVKAAKIETPVAKDPTSKKKPKVQIRIPMTKKWHDKMAVRYVDTVEKQADRYKLDRSMVFAVIHTESAFNPRARSHIPAYGLMQLVPRSAGTDVWKYLKRGDKVPHPEYFYDPTNNIEMGATYLHIVYTRYLRHIKDPTSRLYAAVSAYNTGSGNVAKSFGKKLKRSEAWAKFNAMTPEEVYNHLIQNLPYEETRHYLERVRKRSSLYKNYD